MSPLGLSSSASQRSFEDTYERLLDSVSAHGMTVFAQIDHQAAATTVGLMLRPTRVIIFGNPAAGTLLMKATQTIGIELPMKVIVWEDETGLSWISHQDVGLLGGWPGLDASGRDTVNTMGRSLAGVLSQAIEAPA